MHTAKHDNVRVRFFRDDAQPQRIAHMVRDVLNLGPLIIVRKNDSVLAAGKFMNLSGKL
jgi:hypothetical protein